MPSRHTTAVAIATGAALIVALAAFTRSFSALSDLAIMHQWPADEAWILPISLDGMIVVPTVAAVVRRHARWYAWALLVAGTIMSVACNGTYAWLTTGSRIAVALAVIPPLVTLAAAHLAITVARRDQTTVLEVPTATGPEPTRMPVDRDTERDEKSGPVTRLRVAPETTAPPAAAAPPATASRAAKPRRAASAPATQPILTLDVAPATEDDTRAEAIRLVVAEGRSMRLAGAELGVSKDKVHRWVTAHRATLTATAAV